MLDIPISTTRRECLRAFGLAAALAMSAAPMSAARAQSGQALVEVTVGVLDSLAEAVTFIALDKGYFTAEGLDVKVVKFSNTADMVAPLSSGQLDVASGAPTLGFFNGALRGLPLKLVADKGRNSPGHGFNAIVVRKDLVESGRVKSVTDLKGLKIATPSRYSPMEIQLDIALKKAGLKLDDVSLEQLTFPNMTAAFGSKIIDAGLMIEPFVEIATSRGVGTRFLGADEIEPNFQMAAVIYGPEFVSKKSDAAKRWMVGYVRGIRDYLAAIDDSAGKAELFKLLAKYTNSFKDPSAMRSVVFPGFDPDGYLNLKTVNDSIDWYAQRALLKSKPKLTDIVDYTYVDYALERLGRKGPRQSVQ
jgi:NitT/TauT family transport system substrate-binding protein